MRSFGRGKEAQTDQVGNDFAVAETTRCDLSAPFLAAVAGKYGLDSNEYELAGGTRASERRKSGPKKSPKPGISDGSTAAK